MWRRPTTAASGRLPEPGNFNKEKVKSYPRLRHAGTGKAKVKKEKAGGLSRPAILCLIDNQ
jgi:hypothetical protein